VTTECLADVNLEGESAFMRILGLSFEEIGPEKVTARSRPDRIITSLGGSCTAACLPR
jgi:hypothetical protein